MYCKDHNLKAHAKYRKEHPQRENVVEYELACGSCSHRKYVKWTPSYKRNMVLSGWLRCDECGSAVVSVDEFDVGQIGSAHAVTAASLQGRYAPFPGVVRG